jgi:ribulose-phosphate 3-epimerase
MTTICPTITAYDPHEYRRQMEAVQPFAKRIHIDLMDGRFAPTQSPSLKHVWWPDETIADIHLMYQNPLGQLPLLIKLRPSLVIIHAESEVDHAHFAMSLHKVGIRAGLALLPHTEVGGVKSIVKSFDHVLIFSGNLGHHGGHAQLGLLEKVPEIKRVHPAVEISWDGGINTDNAPVLTAAGVTVLNVGGFIQKAEAPQEAYAKLKEVIKAS